MWQDHLKPKTIVWLKRTLALLALALFLFSFTNRVSHNTKPTKQVWRILPLGDSITLDNRTGDERPREQRTGYRQPLWLALAKSGLDVDFVGSERAGAAAVPRFDPDSGGFPGIQTGELATLLRTGWNEHLQRQVSAGPYLAINQPDIVLLHIGTNNVAPVVTDVEQILDEIGRFERTSKTPVVVILARIINRSCCTENPPCPECAITTAFNESLGVLAARRIKSGQRLIVVDMERGAGLDYRRQSSGGDMFDDLHPTAKGYEKMAVLWSQAIDSAIESLSGSTEQR